VGDKHYYATSSLRSIKLPGFAYLAVHSACEVVCLLKIAYMKLFIRFMLFDGTG